MLQCQTRGQSSMVRDTADAAVSTSLHYPVHFDLPTLTSVSVCTSQTRMW